MKKFCLISICCFSFSSSFCQQRIVGDSYASPFLFSLFDGYFEGKIRTVTKLSFTKGDFKNSVSPDTMIYFSRQSGLFDEADSSSFNLKDLFEGIIFDPNPSSLNFKDQSGGSAKLFDTIHKYDGDTSYETILFYPDNAAFFHIEHKIGDKRCYYMKRQFRKNKTITRITNFYSDSSCISASSIMNYLSNKKFSQMYEFDYIHLKGRKKLKALKYFRPDEVTGKKKLYAVNKYFYTRNGALEKSTFWQYNGVATINGETFYEYYPNR